MEVNGWESSPWVAFGGCLPGWFCDLFEDGVGRGCVATTWDAL
jgi:hypothetical protein